MKLSYSSKERTTRFTSRGSSRVTKLKSRRFTFQTDRAKRPRRKAINWGALLAFLVKVALGACGGLLGSGKYHKWVFTGA